MSRRLPVRGLAVVAVVPRHAFGAATRAEVRSWLDLVQRPFRLGWFGVDLFCVLSGFVITRILP